MIVLSAKVKVASTCKDEGEVPSEANRRAAEVLRARKAQKEVELYDKLIKAGRFHASFKVIGTLSSRMSGADKLNPQGIKSDKFVRECFPLAWPSYQLTGGDFESFEVAIAESVYNDPNLRKDLMSGKKIHGLFAEALFPEETYDSILATKGSDNDLYTKGKQGVFSQIYGGTEYTLQTRLGISEDVAIKAAQRWMNKYPGIKRAQKDILNAFQSMRQPGGLGTKVIWHDPEDYIESKLGFRRYFTLENMICKALFDLAEKPPKDWEDTKIKVVRRDRTQTAEGATRSALFAAAFSIQSANVRAAMNHVIQSTGAQICKTLQRRLWELQPVGCHEFVIMLLNIHDEIMAPANPAYIPYIQKIVDDLINHFKELIPLIAIDWSNDLVTWADK
jgi:DNA polymerase I-like protein with 3'-5' exonuclease and polymerase domains